MSDLFQDSNFVTKYECFLTNRVAVEYCFIITLLYFSSSICCVPKSCAFLRFLLSLLLPILLTIYTSSLGRLFLTTCVDLVFSVSWEWNFLKFAKPTFLIMCPINFNFLCLILSKSVFFLFSLNIRCVSHAQCMVSSASVGRRTFLLVQNLSSFWWDCTVFTGM